MGKITRLDSGQKRQIIHIDFDSFFASVEQQFNICLRGKPIGITATNGRTCIIASSREAKVLGIKTGTRSFEAERIYPGIKLVPADFVKYYEISKKFLNICKDYSPFVELFSIDEVFMDITSTVHLFKSKYNIVEIIKSRIKKEIGEYITVSVGISHNKLLAKLASGLKKPDGVFEIRKDEVDKIYQKVKLTDICGIGSRIGLRLNQIGIYNLLQLRDTPLSLLISEFGKSESEFLKNISWGIDDSEIIPYTSLPSIKSIGRNYCLPKNEYDFRIVLQNIYELCEEISIKLRRLGKKARTIGLRLGGSNNIKGQKTSGEYFDIGKDLFDVSLSIIGANKTSYIRQISVWVTNLEDKNNLPYSLFDADKRKDRLFAIIDSINDRFGSHTIRNGFLLYTDKLTTVPNGYMADKYERTKLALDNSSDVF